MTDTDATDSEHHADPVLRQSQHSWASSPATRAAMQANRRRDTQPEIAVRRLLHARGLRYRVDTRPIPTVRHTADIVFTKARLAVFIDGCWWHGCPQRHRPPRSNSGYWHSKIERNRERDRRVTAQLESAGWCVLRAWEHQDSAEIAVQIERLVRPNPNLPSIPYSKRDY